jgi:serralysin
MTGGAGYDAFGFNTAAESRNGHVDVITDFTPGQDIIAMAGVCYHANVTCTWIGTAQFDGTPGEVRYWTTYPPEGNPVVVVSADLDGDGVSDFQIDLLGAVTLSASDFLFDSYPPN